jgi:hypothetical protein
MRPAALRATVPLPKNKESTERNSPAPASRRLLKESKAQMRGFVIRARVVGNFGGECVGALCGTGPGAARRRARGPPQRPKGPPAAGRLGLARRGGVSYAAAASC